jgi:hypothetical protein
MDFSELGYIAITRRKLPVFNVHAPLSRAERGIASWMQSPAHYATPPTDTRMAIYM